MTKKKEIPNPFLEVINRKKPYDRAVQCREIGKANLWKPGQSGNPSGKPMGTVTTILKGKNPTRIADKLFSMACKGDLGAIREFMDRVEGKVTDTRLSVTANTTLEGLREAQNRLQAARGKTQELLEQYTS